jgi:hypothetical protein
MKWEYMPHNSFRLTREQLNQLGREGWELVSYTPPHDSASTEHEYIFKRKLLEPPAEDNTRIEEISAELSILLEKRADTLPEGREQNIARGSAIDTALLSGDEDRANDLSVRWKMPEFEDL